MITEARKQNDEQALEFLAWTSANIMNPHLKRPVSPAKLLGKKVETTSRGSGRAAQKALRDKMKVRKAKQLEGGEA